MAKQAVVDELDPFTPDMSDEVIEEAPATEGKTHTTATYPLVIADELPDNPPRKARATGYTTGPRTPRWTTILQSVVDLATDKFVLAGEFNTPVGARNVAHAIEKAEGTEQPITPKVAGTFELQTRRFIREDGKKGSRLYVKFTPDGVTAASA